MSSADESLDPLFLDVAAFAQENHKDFGLSAIQRRFTLGYNRASRILDAMIERGLVIRESDPSIRYVVVPPGDIHIEKLRKIAAGLDE